MQLVKVLSCKILSDLLFPCICALTIWLFFQIFQFQLTQRLRSNIDDKMRKVNYIGVGVTPLAQSLFHTITKTWVRINECKMLFCYDLTQEGCDLNQWRVYFVCKYAKCFKSSLADHPDCLIILQWRIQDFWQGGGQW